MRRRPVPPYRQFRPESVACEPRGGWEVEARGETKTLEDGAPFSDWDASLVFALKRRFHFNETALLDLGVVDPEAICLQLVVRMATAGNLSSSVPFRLDLPRQAFQPVDVRISPVLGKLSRDLTLETSIVVLRTIGVTDPLVPSVPGSRIWEDQWRVRLEGGKTRLPFEILDFEDSYRGFGLMDALFHVDVADDPELEFEQGVCVSINSRFETFVSAVERLEPVATALLWDAVLRRVLVAGIGNGFDFRGQYPEPSVGAQWVRWFGQAFPGESIESAQRMLVERPSRFEARVQSWSRVALRLVSGLSS